MADEQIECTGSLIPENTTPEFASINNPGPVFDAIKNNPRYFAVRNIAMRHARVVQASSFFRDPRIVDDAVDSAVAKVLCSTRRDATFKTLTKEVRRVLNRLFRQELKLVRFSEPLNQGTPWTSDDYDPLTPSEPGTITPDSVPDPWDYEQIVFNKINRDRLNAELRRRSLEVMQECEFQFLLNYVERDQHDPPHPSSSRQRFSRLMRTLKAHLKFEWFSKWLEDQ